jgi:predicted membrane-bound spermidine synthase
MSIALSFVFLLSGVAGLVFETLWFRMAGLTFGNSVIASSLVLSSFMAGLAMGNAFAAGRGSRIRRPIVAYAVLECVVGITGLALVLVFPRLPALLAPVWRPLLEAPLSLNLIRFGLGFLLLVIPTTAMGMTLPLMVKALNQHRPDFGSALGWLYGVNTIGAMSGAVLGEWLLIPRLGVLGSAGAAAALNFFAALGALAVERAMRARPAVAAEPAARASDIRPDLSLSRLLLAAALSGALLLALEVVWFRFLQLFILSTTRGFAVMLLVVLLGIGAGGLASTLWLRRDPQAYRLLAPLALLLGFLTMGSYFAFEGAPASAAGARSALFTDTLVLSLRLMLPVSFVSGVLFTFLGRAVYDARAEETAAVGWVTLSNTLGAAAGAVLAGWVFVPGLGVEKSIFLLALAYGAVAVLVFRRSSLATRTTRLAFGLLSCLFAGTAIFFPFGLMKNHFVPESVAVYRAPDAEILEVREGRSETIVYLQSYWMGEPYSARLITNSFSMTATGLRADRYMKHFVYWPLAFHPRIEKALLISYGFGITAGALTSASEIEAIDVVDISRDIVDMSRHVYPDPDQRPLNDPRVDLFIEDGRFFLLASGEQYDLITAEPPPTMVAGVVNLYTQEYFELIRGRLAEGGLVTYWLPVVFLSPDAARSVIKGFCNAFPDCTLWRGARLELVLAGSRNASGPIRQEAFERIWRNGDTLSELTRIGFETPGMLLSTFIGDHAFLEEFTRDAAPLVDNYPDRLGLYMASREEFAERVAFYTALVDPAEVEKRYRSSAFLKDRLPAALFDAGLESLPYENFAEVGLDAGPGSLPVYLEPIDRILTETRLRTPALWLMGDHAETSGVIESFVERNELNETVYYHLGLRAFAERRFDEAERHFASAQELGVGKTELQYYRILALAYAGRLEDAEALARELPPAPSSNRADEAFWNFCQRRFGLEPPPAG